jgi:hypothetical protein
MPTSESTLRVECHSGYRGEENPRRFYLGRRKIEIIELLDRWLAPDHRYFKLRGDDGCLYILRHDISTGDWDLVMFNGQQAEGETPA